MQWDIVSIDRGQNSTGVAMCPTSACALDWRQPGMTLGTPMQSVVGSLCRGIDEPDRGLRSRPQLMNYTMETSPREMVVE